MYRGISIDSMNWIYGERTSDNVIANQIVIYNSIGIYTGFEDKDNHHIFTKDLLIDEMGNYYEVSYNDAEMAYSVLGFSNLDYKILNESIAASLKVVGNRYQYEKDDDRSGNRIKNYVWDNDSRI
jgi:hypothetical protein